MNKQDVITFFDHYASTWDADMIRNESVINTILDNGGVTTGCTVLDVACGTGVLFSDYLQRNVKNVTAVDISPEMARIANIRTVRLKSSAAISKLYRSIRNSTAAWSIMHSRIFRIPSI